MMDPKVSPSMQDYLETILELSEIDDKVRVTDIAAKLKIAKASVTQTIHTLKEQGLVLQERYGPVKLTYKGRECAAKVRYRHRMLKKFLMDVLEVEPCIAERDACLMEHTVSPQTLEKLVCFLEAYHPTDQEEF